MVRLKAWWNTFKNVAILFSFIVNLILIIVLGVVVLQIFQIKNGILEPLVTGLHSSFVGLDQAHIITSIEVKDTITVADTIPVKLDIPLQQNTVVVLTQAVPLRANTSFTLRDGTTLNGMVSLSLPVGMQLPVSLNLNVPVDSTLPINLKVPIDLKVPVNIPLAETQLHDPFNKLRGLLDPYVRVLGNLPNSWGEAVGNALSNKPNDLLRSNDYIDHPWPGFVTGLGTPPPLPTAGAGGVANPPPGNGTGVETPAPTGPTPVPGTATPIPDLGILTPTQP
jgi:hypothetical protein